MIATNRHHCILILLFGKKSEQLLCSNNNMCIVMDPRTHCCACHCGAHYVSAVNQKTVQFQCKSGRLLIAFWRICVIFVFLFSFCFIVCVSAYCLFLFVYLSMFCMNAVVRRLFNPLRRGHLCIYNYPALL